MSDYLKFWDKLRVKLKEASSKPEITKINRNPFLLAPSGITGIYYAFALEYNFPEVFLIIDSSRDINEYYFDNLEKQRRDIEREFGDELIWTRKVQRRKQCQIVYKDLTINYKNQEQINDIYQFFIEKIQLLYNAVQPYIENLHNQLEAERAAAKSVNPARLTHFSIANFLNFNKHTFDTSANINLILGENDTGKTGLLKLLYSIAKSWETFNRKEHFDSTPYKKLLGEKIFDVFQPRENRRIGDLVSKGCNDKLRIDASFAKDENNIQHINFAFGDKTYKTINECSEPLKTFSKDLNSVFVPSKEILTALKTIKYARQKLYLPGFDDTFLDLIKSVEVPKSLKDESNSLAAMQRQLDELFESKIHSSGGEEPFISQKDNKKFSISLTSDGLKRVGIISSLLKNNQIRKGTILFIDEPEANLHPRIIRSFIEVIMEFATKDIQVFLASHNYFVTKQLTIYAKRQNIPVTCHALSKDDNGKTKIDTMDLRNGLPQVPIITESEKMFHEIIG